MSEKINKRIISKGRSLSFMPVLVIFFAVVLSRFFSEENVLFYFALPSMIACMLWSVYVLFSTSCPKCEMLFFYPVYRNEKIGLFRFISAKKCCHCGYLPNCKAIANQSGEMS